MTCDMIAAAINPKSPGRICAGVSANQAPLPGREYHGGLFFSTGKIWMHWSLKITFIQFKNKDAKEPFTIGEDDQLVNVEYPSSRN